jgi:signal transduction histidine kinase
VNDSASYLLRFFEGEECTFDGIPLVDEVTVGRHGDCTVTLADESISRQHASFLVERHGDRTVVTLTDSSTNGCVVNARACHETTMEVKPGDAIEVGSCRVELMCQEDDADLLPSASDPAAKIVFEAPATDDSTVPDLRLRVLSEFSERSSQLDGADLIHAASDVLKKSLPFSVLYIHITNEGEPPHRFAFTPQGACAPGEVTVSRTLIKKCLEQGVAIVADNAAPASPDDYNQSVVLRALRSAMCVPVRAGGRTRGVIYASSPMHLSYHEKDLQLLVPLATLLGSRISASRAFLALRAETRKLDVVLGGLEEAVLLTDRDFGVLTSNAAAEEVFGCGVVGRSLPELLSGFDHNFAPHLLPRFSSFKLSEKHGTEGKRARVFEATLSTNSNPDVSTWKYVVCVRDVSKRSCSENVASRLVCRLVDKLSAPLGRLESVNADMAELAARSGDSRLRTLVDEVSVLWKECTGVVNQFVHYAPLGLVTDTSVRWAKIPLEDLIAAALSGHTDLMRRKRFCVRQVFEPGAVQVYGDRERLDLALHHVIENAIEYGRPEGALLISVEKGTPLMKISFLDDGPGVPPKEMKQLAETLGRVPDGGFEEPPERGLGLWVAQRIVQAHLGQLRLTSPVNDNGTGTLVEVSLPGVRRDRDANTQTSAEVATVL